MRFRIHLVVAVMWSLSLVLVAEWSASAQVARPIPNATPQVQLPNIKIRFVREPSNDALVRGHLVANINGRWEVVVMRADGMQQ